MMEWIPLEKIESSAKFAQQINRNIAELEEFREEAAPTTDEAPKNVLSRRFRTADDKINEALRREVILRVDLVAWLRNSKAGDVAIAEEQSRLNEVNRILDERGGHR